jgi:hypothetical protein
VHRQLEAVGQQGLQHQHQSFVVADWIFGFGQYFEAVDVDPVGTSDDQARADSEGAHDAALQGNVFAVDAAVTEFNIGDGSGGVARFDGGDFEALRGGGIFPP